MSDDGASPESAPTTAAAPSRNLTGVRPLGPGWWTSRTRGQTVILALLLAATAAALPSAFGSFRGFQALTGAADHEKSVSVSVADCSGQIAAGSGPIQLMQLTLAPSADAANALLREWDRPVPGGAYLSPLQRARCALAVDDAFIWRYTRLLVLLAAFAWMWAYCRRGWLTTASQRGQSLTHGLLLLILILALSQADRIENSYLRELLGPNGSPARRSIEEGTLAGGRLSTQLKLATLGLVGAGLVLTLAFALRRECRSRRTAEVSLPPPCQTFKELIDREHGGILDRAAAGRWSEVRMEAAGEPWVRWCSEELVGLALSGGGIRSATFNLGLLQGLHRLNLLRHIDYLATVSGGGYIGGFWSKWLTEHADAAGRPPVEMFPDEVKKSAGDFTGDTRVFEAAEIRHMREFGKFLVPRTGFFDTETWGAVVAWLASLGPALAGALSVLGLSLVAWLVATFYLACPHPAARAIFAVALTAVVFLAMECWLRGERTSAGEAATWPGIAWRSGVAIAFVGGLSLVHFGTWPIMTYASDGWTSKWVSAPPAAASYAEWWALVGIHAPPKAFVISLPLYEPIVPWLLTAAALMLFRFRGAFAAPSMDRRVKVTAVDRTTMRLLGLALSWTILATFWHLGVNLKDVDVIVAAATGAAGSGGAFALLRNWIGKSLATSQKGSWRDLVKPYVPQVLAYLAVGLAWALVARALIAWCGEDWSRWCVATFAMVLVVLLLLLVDPAEFGLHAFYRDRICRAYLGAARVPPPTPVCLREDQVLVHGVGVNRQTDLQRDDDISMDQLLARPLHLVCCAANDLSGDHLATLSRGARSAVLSRHGIAIADRWAADPAVQLGSALTASAAAFNSNMGSVSMEVGPAVSFLMSALNLRLGLWVPSPEAPGRPIADRLLPGWLFFREMFAWTSASGRDLHLSDGAHFDNLGLYELVRRHCRYIIVSDCTADPDVAFDDFGNTARRIREDFGVEIDIDLDPLKPGPDGRARQHATVGTLDYGWFDKGVLVYVKPSLTGDEPPDTRQYKMRNAAFPHESTGDQFYDEAQWESYRRLGVHTARSVLGFADRIALRSGSPREQIGRAQELFAKATQVWYPAPPGLVDRVIQMSARFAQLEDEIKADANVPMLPEVFPELDDLRTAATPPPSGRALGGFVQDTVRTFSDVGRTLLSLLADGPAATPHRGERTASQMQDRGELANLGYLLRVMTLMEDAILACSLDAYWNHPVNLGWVNSFARWATTPAFLRWWPLLKPMYGPALRGFLEDRFAALRDVASRPGEVAVVTAPNDAPQELALKWWHERDHAPTFAGKTVLAYRLTLPGVGGSANVTVQVGLLAVTIVNDRAVWTSDDFFVPLSLWGGGLGTAFLQRVLRWLEERYIVSFEVHVKDPDDAGSDPAQWQERTGFVNFYRQAGFRFDRVEQYDERLKGRTRSRRRAILRIR